MTPREWAERYAALGLRVVPTPPGGKYPQGVGRWQDVATADLSAGEAASWWTGSQADHSISVALGERGTRCVFVVDVDEAGKAAWRALVEAHGLPVTWTAATGGGGWHLWFWTYLHVTNANTLPQGIDVRGEGGQVVVPPSIHATGARYEWVEGLAPWDVKLAKAPDWLLPLLTEPEPEVEAEAVSDQVPAGPPPEVQGERPGDRWQAATDWAQVLEPDGWTLAKHDRRTGERHWTRPGKSTRDGSSATTGFGSHDVLKVFTSSVPQLEAEGTYTKLGYLAAMHHGGDLRAATQALVDAGWAPPDLGDELLAAHDTPRQPVAEARNAHQDEQAEQVEVSAWPEPRAIPRGDPPPPWPRQVLPDWMQAQVDNVATQLLCPPDLPGMFALGALATIGLGTVQVEVRRGHQEHVPAWLIVGAPPSEGKSPAMQMMFSPLYALEVLEMEGKAEEVAQADVRRSVAEKAAKRAEEAAAKADDPLEALDNAATLRQAASAVEVPPEGRLIVGDVTPEKLAQVLSRNAERIAIVSDEAGALSFDRYGDKQRGSNLDIYLKAWSGQRAAVDRISAPTILLARPLLTIVLGAQPEAWQRALEDDEFRTRGLGARFMAATPTSIAHLRRMDYERDVWDEDVADRYHQRLHALGRKWLHWGTAHVVPTSAARRTFGAWADAQFWRYQEGGPMEGDGAWFGKMYDTLWRLAALIHLAEGHQASEPLSEAVAARVTALGDYWVAHRALDTTDTSGPARRLLRTLANLADEDWKVAKVRLQRGGPRDFRKVTPEVADLMEALAYYGWLKVAWPGQPVGRDRWWQQSFTVHLNPAAGQWKRAPGERQSRATPAEYRPPTPAEQPTNHTLSDDDSTHTSQSSDVSANRLYSLLGASSAPETALETGPLADQPKQPKEPPDDDIGMDLFGR